MSNLLLAIGFVVGGLLAMRLVAVAERGEASGCG